ncbi:MAG: hypothetical protein R2911_04160 [Caldilineaceae bacterium]
MTLNEPGQYVVAVGSVDARGIYSAISESVTIIVAEPTATPTATDTPAPTATNTATDTPDRRPPIRRRTRPYRQRPIRRNPRQRVPLCRRSSTARPLRNQWRPVKLCLPAALSPMLICAC